MAPPPIQRKKAIVKIGMPRSNAANICTIVVNSQKNLAVGKEEYDLRPLKGKFARSSGRLQNTISLPDVKVAFGRDAFTPNLPGRPAQRWFE